MCEPLPRGPWRPGCRRCCCCCAHASALLRPALRRRCACREAWAPTWCCSESRAQRQPSSCPRSRPGAHCACAALTRQAPARANIWGFGAPAAAQVVVTLRATGAAAPAANVSASAAADGSWAVLLPPQPSGAESGGAPTAYTIRATVGGEAALIDDVLFGEVWLCGGQSNMQFSVGNASNATCAFTPPHSRPPAAA